MASTNTYTHNLKIWSDTCQSWQQSGLTQKHFCEQEGLALGTFSYWRSQLKKNSLPCPVTKPKFLPVVRAITAPSSLTLCINQRLEITVTPDFDPDFLRQVIQAIEGLS